MKTYKTEMVQLAKDKGLILRRVNRLQLCTAGLIFKDGRDYTIHVNRFDRKPRQRYTIAVLISYFKLNKDGVDNSPIPIKLNYTTGFHNEKSLTIKSAEMALDLLVPNSVFDACIKEQYPDGLIYDKTIAELADIFEVPLVLIEKRVGSKRLKGNAK